SAQEKKVARSKVGEKVGLPCCYKIPNSESLQNYRVYWQMNVTDVVLAYSGGEKIHEHSRYVNRTKLDLKNLTLWIYGVEILDGGPYQCIVQSLQSSPDKPGSHLLCGEPVTLFVTVTKCCWALRLCFIFSASAKANDCIISTALPSYSVITASSIIIITFLLAIALAAKYFPRHACSRCSKNQDSAEEDVKEIMNPPKNSKVTCEMSSL
ncbi:UNVERIFIED_CONTAM: hypothetical protein H355_016849, partial [Colinus virginianus]